MPPTVVPLYDDSLSTTGSASRDSLCYKLSLIRALFNRCFDERGVVVGGFFGEGRVNGCGGWEDDVAAAFFCGGHAVADGLGDLF